MYCNKCGSDSEADDWWLLLLPGDSDRGGSSDGETLLLYNMTEEADPVSLATANATTIALAPLSSPSPSPLPSSPAMSIPQTPNSPLLNVLRRFSPVSQNTDASVPRASSPLAITRAISSAALSAKSALKSYSPDSKSRLQCEAEHIVKRPLNIAQSPVCTAIGNGDSHDYGDEDDDNHENSCGSLAGYYCVGGSGWKGTAVAVLLAAAVSLLFLTMTVPLDALFGGRSNYRGTLDSYGSRAAGAPAVSELDALKVFDGRTAAQLAAVLGACREVRIARAAFGQLVQGARDALAQLADTRPAILLSAAVREIIDAIRSLLLLFF